MTDILPDMMYAAIMAEEGTLVYDLMPTPDPYKGEVVVRVHAAAVNLEDVFYRNDRYSIQKDLPHILGSDAAGEIVLLGEDVEDWALGERVILSYEALGVERDGTYAEYVAVPTEYLGRIPEKMDYRSAATVTYALCRAWAGLTYNAKIRKREYVVINGASSPLGLAALAIARWKECTIIAIDNPRQAAQLRNAGASMVLDENSADLLTLILTITDDAGVSLAVDLMGAASISHMIEYLAFDGRVLSLATYSGDIAQINLQDLMAINGSILTASDKLKAGDMEKLLDMLVDASLSSVTDSVLPMSKAHEAHQRMESDTAFGSILLVPDTLF